MIVKLLNETTFLSGFIYTFLKIKILQKRNNGFKLNDGIVIHEPRLYKIEAHSQCIHSTYIEYSIWHFIKLLNRNQCHSETNIKSIGRNYWHMVRKSTVSIIQ